MIIVSVIACCDPILNNAHPELTETHSIHVAVVAGTCAVSVDVAGGDDDGGDNETADGTVDDDGCKEERITVGCRED